MKTFLQWKGHRWVALPVRVYLAFVFLFACVHKILHPDAFAVDVATYQILPLSLVNLVAITLPWVELAAGLALLAGFRARAGALLVAAMMAVFLFALSWALAKGLDMSCGCFASQGAGEDPISFRTVLRDLGWLLLALYVLWLDRHPVGVDAWLERRRAT
ncbi:DoxX family membrane protein [Myxococcota bacterium]|nr:DoxX family membrane protein [Myxococcota bacterium]